MAMPGQVYDQGESVRVIEPHKVKSGPLATDREVLLYLLGSCETAAVSGASDDVVHFAEELGNIIRDYMEADKKGAEPEARS